MDWKKLIDEHGAKLVLYARQWCDSLVDAEDAVQTAVVKLWKKHEADESLPLGRVFVAVKHAAIDTVRSSKRRRLRELKANEEELEGTSLFEAAEIEEERRKLIEHALGRLPVEQREVIVMKIWSEMTFKEIGRALGISQNTAAARYRYGLRALVRMLPHSTASTS
ncbi:MAG: sigma-70 family RNA polymerase sigma factor [Kiritimatiellia bacterium]|nr:sigma-70 family RNA polymerase sigma factor [Kiritimatiellia bacterium]